MGDLEAKTVDCANKELAVKRGKPSVIWRSGQERQLMAAGHHPQARSNNTSVDMRLTEKQDLQAGSPAFGAAIFLMGQLSSRRV
jgi:hypothetical protein